MTDPTQRFSTRVADYVRARPSYPPAVLDTLVGTCGLGPGTVVADLGAGTGIFSALLLARGGMVYAIEPNAAMRTAAEAALGDQPGFVSRAGTAEATGLPDGSVDLVTAAQAFHWFDAGRAGAEVRRILRPAGWAALVWNERVTSGNPFLTDYEALLVRYGTDYAKVDHRQVGPRELAAYYGPGGYKAYSFANRQDLDLTGLTGRVRSSSYTPEPGDPRFEPMMAGLGDLFRRYQVDGRVAMLYQTQLFVGRMT